MKSLKRLVIAAILAVTLATPSILRADGCNSSSCTSSGSYVTYGWQFPFVWTCYWTFTVWFDNGSYSYTDTCGGGSSYFGLP